MKIVQSFAPDIVVLQLGTNDLQTISTVESGSALKDLTRLLYESYGVHWVCGWSVFARRFFAGMLLYLISKKRYSLSILRSYWSRSLTMFIGDTEASGIVNQAF